jgi:hypothetical protein
VTLRDALERSALSGHALRWAPLAPRLPGIAARLVARYGDEDARRLPAADRALLLQRLRQAGFDWDRIDGRDRLAVAWVLWDGADPPAGHAAFLAGFLRWLECPWRRVQASRVAAAWAAAFDPQSNSIRAVGDWLASHASRLLQPWTGLAARFELFAPERGPAKLAEAFLADDTTAGAFCKELRLPDSAAGGGLMFEVLDVAADLARSRLAAEPHLAARLIDLSLRGGNFRPDATPGIMPARRRTIRARLAEALLLPWQAAAPPPEAKASVVDHLLRRYRDPRPGGGAWRDIDPAAAAIMGDWLKETTIATFFGLAGRQRGADPQPAQARQEFWISRSDRIDDAWLIAGRQGAAAAEAKGLGYGRLVGCPPDGCALLLKINGSTVIEMPRLGDQRVWRPGNPLAPPLDRCTDHAYSPASLAAGADFAFGYSRGDGGAWQLQFNAFIERGTGIGREPG